MLRQFVFLLVAIVWPFAAFAQKNGAWPTASAVWEVNEATDWNGRWVQRGSSDTFDIFTTNKWNGIPRHHVATVAIRGNEVTASHPDGTTYRGQLSADRTQINGVHMWNGLTGNWTVRILQPKNAALVVAGNPDAVATSVSTPTANQGAIQKTPPSLAEAAQIAASKVLPPTNNFVELSKGKGEVVTLDALGTVLKAEGRFLPRIPLSALTESDIRALLQTIIGRDAVGSLNTGQKLRVGCEPFEQRLRETWLQGESLHAKIANRLTVLGEMGKFNTAIATYASFVGSSQGLNALAESANGKAASAEGRVASATDKIDDGKEILGNYISYTYRRPGYQLVRDGKKELRAAMPEYNKAQQVAEITAGQANYARGGAEASKQECEARAAKLKSLGYEVILFRQIPSLALFSEVDAQRLLPWPND